MTTKQAPPRPHAPLGWRKKDGNWETECAECRKAWPCPDANIRECDQ